MIEPNKKRIMIEGQLSNYEAMEIVAQEFARVYGGGEVGLNVLGSNVSGDSSNGNASYDTDSGSVRYEEMALMRDDGSVISRSLLNATVILIGSGWLLGAKKIMSLLQGKPT